MREQARIKETSKINGEYLEEGLFNIPEEELKVDSVTYTYAASRNPPFTKDNVIISG